MSSSDLRAYGVWLQDVKVGSLYQRVDRTRFILDQSYIHDPHRPILGLVFEQNLNRIHSSQLKLPEWFSNLLPEGRLRQWIAEDRGVSSQREMELLAQVGHDLPGAVRVLPGDESPDDVPWEDVASSTGPETADHGIRFSLAGVAMKFSMIRKGDRLTMPAYGEGGDWIVKLPDRTYRDVPLNEFAMMTLAGAVGIAVPEIKLITRDKFDGIPESAWPGEEEHAFAIRRFDRDDQRKRIHIEDLAQVRNLYPSRKYDGNFETVASLIYRGHDEAALLEFTRRLTFCILISNGDAHLKNWSLIYRDPQKPTLSPAYDLLCTSAYQFKESPEDLGLKFGGSRAFHDVSLATFARLQQRLGVKSIDLPGCARDIVARVTSSWPEIASSLDRSQALQSAIDSSIRMRTKTLLR
ncbi:HipA domain-containing protein [Actinomadura kijaniata]|uniref:Serine/threonine-protein kinase HipA n=1 Tax=Actinomadura namibiensis TaxID=182080 RepID=A0A7W3LL92_ACTNM|nr:HipA domain-containing protein [Actinomadura namibiensis]MBA8950212.1 serine/threonine-protein kinase HipA [Actinomadura namibiensis]